MTSSPGEQGVDEIGADEARATCDERSHRAAILAPGTARKSKAPGAPRTEASRERFDPPASPPSRGRRMRLIVTEKNNSAKKIAEILGGGRQVRQDLQGPVLHLDGRRGRAHLAIGLKGTC